MSEATALAHKDSGETASPHDAMQPPTSCAGLSTSVSLITNVLSRLQARSVLKPWVRSPGDLAPSRGTGICAAHAGIRRVGPLAPGCHGSTYDRRDILVHARLEEDVARHVTAADPSHQTENPDYGSEPGRIESRNGIAPPLFQDPPNRRSSASQRPTSARASVFQGWRFDPLPPSRIRAGFIDKSMRESDLHRST